MKMIFALREKKEMEIVSINKLIKNIKTIDYESVVYCKNCKYYQRDGFLEGFGWCYFYHRAFKNNDFCSQGKKNE